MIEQILEYLVEYIERLEKIEYKLGQWLYALLVVLEMPLTPETCSCLRSLARTCSVMRAKSVINTNKSILLHMCMLHLSLTQIRK